MFSVLHNHRIQHFWDQIAVWRAPFKKKKKKNSRESQPKKKWGGDGIKLWKIQEEEGDRIPTIFFSTHSSMHGYIQFGKLMILSK